MADTNHRHEVPAAERAQLIRELQQALLRDNIVAPDSLTATISPEQLPRTDNLVIKGYIPHRDETRFNG